MNPYLKDSQELRSVVATRKSTTNRDLGFRNHGERGGLGEIVFTLGRSQIHGTCNKSIERDASGGQESINNSSKIEEEEKEHLPAAQTKATRSEGGGGRGDI
jgi:hypothetical protein